MVDLSGFEEAIKEELFPTKSFHGMELIHILGMAGLGKTKICKKVVEDPEVLGHFDHHVWLTLGSKYKSEKIIPDILARASSETGTTDLETFLAKRWLIVLDDVWSAGIFYFLSKAFPIRGKILVTTRQFNVVMYYVGRQNIMHLLSKEESWLLFCRKVFGEVSCPPELEKAGRKIVENCEGLPLLILTVAESLSKYERMTNAPDPELWDVLAKEKEHPLFLEAYDEVSKVLYPSYEYLPQHMRACFLYMGAFPRSSEIQTTKLVNLLTVEGFLEAKEKQTVEKVARYCMGVLEEQNLIMSCEDGSSNTNAKSYRLHSSFWHLSNNLAAKRKCLHVLDKRAAAVVDGDDDECEDVIKQCRLCIRNCIALIDNNVYSAMASSEAARSFLCFGPVNRYPVPINLGLRLLRVLDALTIRFFEFPTDIVELAYLRYLALTCDGNLPSTISKLWFLQFLIIQRYLTVKSLRKTLSLPEEIWDMKELRHLHVSGSSLPDPDTYDRLPNLSTLIDINVESCTEKILSRMPGLKKLRVCIELAPRDACDKTFRRLNLKIPFSTS